MRVLIAGGGTGGHLFPGIALAEEFKRRDPNSVCVFVGTERGMEATVVPREGFELRTVEIGGLKGKNIREKSGNLLRIPKSVYLSIRIIREYMPELVVGMGGYASAPVVFGALLMRVKRVICEQNTIPGITNRILARIANRIFVSFPETKHLSSMGKTRFTGNPIRKGITNVREGAISSTGKFTLLILGGSQGAHSINEAVLAALDHLIPMRNSLRIIHQTGDIDYQLVSEAYAAKKFDSDVSGFIDDMASAYSAADLIVCRAGATTISELTACGKASILIPYPYAADNHQEVNARVLCNRGAAKIVLNKDLCGRDLALMIRGLADDPSTLFQMKNESLKLGRPRASKDIVESCYELLGRN